MQKTEWLAQVRKGLLEYAILMIILEKPIYGYDLLSELNRYEAFSTTEGTIYPLLRRIEKNGLIHSHWQETSPGTPPRKYYTLTDLGKRSLQMMQEGWNSITSAINTIREGGKSK